MTDPVKLAPGTPGASAPARRRLVDFALTRLRSSRVLQVCAAVSFIDYGGLVMLALKRNPDGRFIVPAFLALFMALMSVASWSFMFGWYPFLESLIGPGTRDGRMKAVGKVLETLAIACVAVVHAMLTMVLVAVITNRLTFL